MWTDPIVEELHRIRETHAARFDNDLWKIAEDLRAIEANWPAAKITPQPQSPIEKTALAQQLTENLDTGLGCRCLRQAQAARRLSLSKPISSFVHLQ